MRKIDIPQEENITLEGAKKVMYALDDNGNFNRHSYGSKIEEFATQTAVDEFEYLANKSLEQYGSSPIEYFMYKNRMDIQTLARLTGFFSFRVKRHLKMKHFTKLNEKILTAYCQIFNISLEKLQEIKKYAN